MGMGVFLIVLNSFISKQEDNDLEAYVQRQLTRSRSGKDNCLKVPWECTHPVTFNFRTSIGEGRGDRWTVNAPCQETSGDG